VVEVVAVLERANVAGAQMLDHLEVGARNIVGYHVRPVFTDSGENVDAVKKCVACGHQPSGGVEWLRFL
jgi:hypothetical protein